MEIVWKGGGTWGKKAHNSWNFELGYSFIGFVISLIPHPVFFFGFQTCQGQWKSPEPQKECCCLSASKVDYYTRLTSDSYDLQQVIGTQSLGMFCCSQSADDYRIQNFLTADMAAVFRSVNASLCEPCRATVPRAIFFCRTRHSSGIFQSIIHRESYDL